MPEIPVESATLFQNSITELEQAESALELAWNELEKQTAETIAHLAKAGSANTQEISDRLAGAKQLRQQLQSQIKQANSRLEFHLENTPMAVIEWDREFRVVRWSPMAEQIFGWSAAELIGKYGHEPRSAGVAPRKCANGSYRVGQGISGSAVVANGRTNIWLECSRSNW